MHTLARMPLAGRLERWLVGVILAAAAYLIERTILHAMRRNRRKQPIHGTS